VQEKFYGKELILADREMVESNSEEILKDAHTEHVAFLVVGDPFGSAAQWILIFIGLLFNPFMLLLACSSPGPRHTQTSC